MNKLKKGNKIMLFFGILITIAYFVCYFFIFKSLLSLEGIETTLRIIFLAIFGIYGILYLIFGVKKSIKKKIVGFVILSILTIIFSAIFAFASYYINFIYEKIENITASETSTYTTVLITLNDTTFTDESVIGIITDEDDKTGYILPLELISEDNMTNEIEYYSSYLELLEALYNNEVDAIFINKDYVTIYSNDDTYANIASETTVIKSYSKEMTNDESELLATTKSLTEPFTVLILGVDSDETDGLDANAAYNGDTIILVTFNPKTLSATILSIPRDTYVPIYNSNNRYVGYSKINASAAYGTMSTINTIEHLTGIEIDYYVKINFQGVIDLVDAIGGIEVEIEEPDYNYYISQWGPGVLCESGIDRTYINPVCMYTGLQTLNGEQALAYARNRHAYLESDIARNRHQQQVIEAIAKKLVQTSSLSDLENILDTISNNIATNMKTNQILSFYQSIKSMLSKVLNGEDFITIQKLQLTYFTFTNTYGLSCIGYYSGSLDLVVSSMEENLEITTTKTIKTFSYDYTTDYEQTTDVIGKGVYTGTKVPDSSYYYVETKDETTTDEDDEEETKENTTAKDTDNDTTNEKDTQTEDEEKTTTDDNTQTDDTKTEDSTEEENSSTEDTSTSEEEEAEKEE